MKAEGKTKETIMVHGVTDRGFPSFRVGDTIAVTQRIKEGNKERAQVFEGDVIAMKTRGIASTFTVRKIGAHSIAVERIFPLYSPRVSKIKIVKHGDVRRAKLYYVRERIGKAARLREKIITKRDTKTAAQKTPEAPAPEADTSANNE